MYILLIVFVCLLHLCENTNVPALVKQHKRSSGDSIAWKRPEGKSVLNDLLKSVKIPSMPWFHSQTCNRQTDRGHLFNSLITTCFGSHSRGDTLKFSLSRAGGSISGAIFNPVLAFSVQFPCSGHTYLEYCFIYWLGPLLGKEPCWSAAFFPPLFFVRIEINTQEWVLKLRQILGPCFVKSKVFWGGSQINIGGQQGLIG